MLFNIGIIWGVLLTDLRYIQTYDQSAGSPKLMKIRKLLSWQTLMLCALGFVGQSVKGSEAERVVILANANESESVALAEHYADQREIPRANIIALPMSAEETITIPRFIEEIFNPLRVALMEADWLRGVPSVRFDRYGRGEAVIVGHNIAYLVVCKGVPLRMENDSDLLSYAPEDMDPRMKINRAAVDSELALLAAPLQPMVFHVGNPLFEQRAPSRSRLSSVVRVSRLDGPSYADARRLVDNAIEAERRGLHGRAYVDAKGPFPHGDAWLESAAALLETAGFDTDLRREQNELLDWGHRLDAPAFYLGWYRQHIYGPWKDRRLDPPVGAIGFHLHSFSATSLRTTERWWAGGLVANGFAATVGNVYEPYLEFTHRPQLFVEKLLSGGTWGEAVFYSLPVLSWQSMALGDPLYRPFPEAVDTPLATRDLPSGAIAYAYLREMNLLSGEGKLAEARALGREGFERMPSVPLALRLAELAEKAGDPLAAKQHLAILEFISTYPVNEVMVFREAADLLVKLGEEAQALGLYRKLIAQSGLPRAQRGALLGSAVELAESAGQRSLAGRWRSDLARLEAGSD